MDECSHIISQNQGSFLWTPEDVEMKEITQIGTSACGATAVLNILVCARCIHADVCTVFNLNAPIRTALPHLPHYWQKVGS